MHEYLADVIDFTDPISTNLPPETVAEAQAALLRNDASFIRNLTGSFTLLARSGKKVRLARSMDRPLRYFLSKRVDGPALIVAHRIDEIHAWLEANNFQTQFHPSYTRMVPAHFIVEIQLIGCPDPDPTYTRFFEPGRTKIG